jgi:thiol-disulfide isomerase/thioredoxin
MMRIRTMAGLGAGTVAVIIAVLIALRAAAPPHANGPQPAAPNISDGAPFIVLPTPRPVAPLNFTDGEDSPMILADFRGRMVLLNLWATWCVPCRKEMPALARLQAKLGGPGFTVVPLSIDHRGRDVVARFYRELGLTSLGIYVDRSGNATFAVNAMGMPTTLLIDAQGRELGRVVGPTEWDGTAMLSQLTSYLEVRGHQVGAASHTN